MSGRLRVEYTEESSDAEVPEVGIFDQEERLLRSVGLNGSPVSSAGETESRPEDGGAESPPHGADEAETNPTRSSGAAAS
jgi:hypothetical protein